MCLKDEFLGYLKTTKGKADNTISAYSTDLKQFYVFLKEKKNIMVVDAEVLNNVTLQDMHCYLEWLSGRGDGAATKARKVATLKSYFKYLRMMKHIKENVMIDLETPKIGKRLPKSLTLDESNDMLDEIHGENSTRDLCVMTVLLHTGLRISELCGINRSDINGNALKVIGKGNKERVIYLDDKTMKTIEEWLKVRPEVQGEDSDALFISGRNPHKRICIRSGQAIVKRCLRRIDKDVEFSAHSMRSSFATLLHENGEDIRTIQLILGHEQLVTTQRYVGVSKEIMGKAMANNPLNK